MQKIIILLLILSSCNTEYQQLSSDTIEGKISAIDTGWSGARSSTPTTFYVQSDKETKKFSTYQHSLINKYKVGDSIILVVQTVEKIKNESSKN